jgi:signal transduction histidine kinase
LLKVAAVGELVPTILHELKNPLSAVTTAVELLIEELESSTAQSDLHAVLTELHRMRLMLDGVGSVGQSLRSVRARAIDQALREAIQVLSRHASDQQIELREKVDDLPLLKLEPTVLRAVVFNLVMNAIQASGPGKTVTLQVSLVNGGSRLKIQVCDQGCGMSPEILTRCRELFYTTKPRGTGVGLALCSQVMDEVGGDLEIDSTPGHGTTVTLLIPLPTTHQ